MPRQRARVITTASALLLFLSLPGCARHWVTLDSAQASVEQIEKAKTVCNVERRLMILEAELQIYDLLIASAETAYSRDSVKRNRKKKVRAVQAEIEQCMLTRGLKLQ